MGGKSAIEWTDATWNPLRGCTRVSAGCENCYAERVAARFSGPGQPYEGLATTVNGHARWTNQVRLVPEHLQDPLRWKKPRRIFVNSMSDLFHDAVPDTFIQEVFSVMYRAHHHTYQVLTKRPERMQRLVSGMLHAGYSLPPHIWLGVSVEDQQRARERVLWLLETPAFVRWLSCEPLLGPLDLTHITLHEGEPPHEPGVWLDALTGLLVGPDDVMPRINWVVAGGESGPKHRPMNPEWARYLRDQCQITGVPFFFKQWGGLTPKANGRLLDGELWNEYPAVAS